MSATKLACPICKKDVGARPENKAWPFCSARCKTIDLGRWANEEYRIPVVEEEDEDGTPALPGPPVGHA